MLVTKDTFDTALEEIRAEGRISFDTETTGLNSFLGDYAFALVVGTRSKEYYFDYNPLSPDPLFMHSFLKVVEVVFHHPGKIVGAHNAKFDMHMSNSGFQTIKPTAQIWDTEIMARLVNNSHASYSLKNCAERAGMKKGGDEIAEYLAANADTCYRVVKDFTGSESKVPCYDRVPRDLMYRYAIQDARITFDLMEIYEKELAKQAAEQTIPQAIIEIERQATKTLFRMEQSGIRVNADYCLRAYQYEMGRQKAFENQWKETTGTELVDSAKSIGDLLIADGVVLGKTPDGNPSTASWVLENAEDRSPLAKLLLQQRDAAKRATTYFANFIRLADSNGKIHTNFRQRQAITGRTSAAEPNLQNVGKSDNSDYPVRRAFVPSEGFCFVELDFKAQEFRMAVDYSSEPELARMIESGHDPHQAAADMSGLTRTAAKTMNFAILYGVGKDKLAKMLGVTPDEAALLKARYFNRIPGIKRFLYKASDMAKSRGYVISWDGARHYYPDPQKAYKAANSLIQGGCAGASKNMINLVQNLVESKGLRTRLVLQVHDSLLLEMPEDEFKFIPEIQACFRASYPHHTLPMDSSVEYSWESWHDMKKGFPVGKTEGSTVQIPVHEVPKPDPGIMVDTH